METILVAFLVFYMIPCVALITMLYLDSRPGKNALQKEEVVLQRQLGEPPEISPMTESQKEGDTSQKQVGGLPATNPMTESKHKFIGIKGRILSSYIDGLEAIAKTGITVAPHTTLRGPLKSITSLSPTISEAFADLTTLTEIALYSAHELDENTAIRAERLAATIKQSQIPSQK